MAGCYREFDGQNCFVILTTCANPSVAGVHDRMPLLLESRELEAWIFDNEKLEYFLGKTLQGAISFPLGFGIYRLLCGDATVFAGPDVRITPAPVIHILIIVAIACIGIVFLHRILFPEK